MKFRHSYHPLSYSAQAREMADNTFKQVIKHFEGKVTIEYPPEFNPEKWASELFSSSFLRDFIRFRAAKRYGRKMRKYKNK